jgi:CheY-like chemotaxis protein
MFKLAKVLLVEDEASLLQLLSEVVSDLGHKVFMASNGQEALSRIEQEHPDLVISDVMMPVMNGYILLEQIKLKPKWQNIKTILISAAPIDRTHLPPADAYVTKPYNLELIENIIQRLIVSS